MSIDNIEKNDNCSFHSTEVNNNVENITEEQIGEWEIAYRLESIEDLEKAMKDIYKKAKEKGVDKCF